MSAVLSFFRPAPVARGDWSQQEVAEFYRVEAALVQAGLRITSDRGVTDEGDPWFVFLRPDGDLIVHFARIGGVYVVGFDPFEPPLRGPDFRRLLNELAEQHPTVIPVPRSGGNLVLHPAALLAAIVAAAAYELSAKEAVAHELVNAVAHDSSHDGTFDAGPGYAVEGFHPAHDHDHAVSQEQDRQQFSQIIVAAMLIVEGSLALRDFETWTTAQHPVLEQTADSALLLRSAGVPTLAEGSHDLERTEHAHLLDIHATIGLRSAQWTDEEVHADRFLSIAPAHDVAVVAVTMPKAEIVVASFQAPRAEADTTHGSDLPILEGPHGAAAHRAGATAVDAAPAVNHGSDGSVGSPRPATADAAPAETVTVRTAAPVDDHAAATSAAATAHLAAANPTSTATSAVASTAHTSTESLSASNPRAAIRSEFASVLDSRQIDASATVDTTNIPDRIRQQVLDVMSHGHADRASDALNDSASSASLSGRSLLSGLLDSSDHSTSSNASGSGTDHASTTSGASNAIHSGTDAAASSTGTSGTAHSGSAQTTAVAGSGTTDASHAADTQGPPPQLDDAARALIASFIERTPLLDRVAYEHSYIIYDTDVSHYTAADFAVRTWTVSEDLTVTIIGLATDRALHDHPT